MNIDGLAWRTIWLEADQRSVGVIDQTLLPHRLITRTLTRCDQAADAISTMVVRGAPLIGVTGAYGLIRFTVPLFPEAAMEFAPIAMTLAAISIVYCAKVAFGQDDLKRLIAYTSVSHMGFVLIGIGSFSELGTSGAMLQMISHGLIGASLFFLVGATYDRTHTLQLDEMGGIGQKMRIMFALWTVCCLASLALPGMSGFVSELMVFTGFATDEAYTLSFRIVIDGLAAIGVILTPIYLLSMLREIFFGKENSELVSHSNLVDAEPREVYIIGCLLVPIIGIGLYPKIMTDSYSNTISALVRRDVDAMERITRPTAPLIRSTSLVPALFSAPKLTQTSQPVS